MNEKKPKLIQDNKIDKGIKNIFEFLDSIGKAFIPMGEAIQNVLNDIDPKKLKIFLEGIDKFQKNEPYLTELLDQLKNNDNLSHANEALSLACFIQLIYENDDKPEDVNIFDVINSDYFNNKFFSAVNQIKLGENFTKREFVLKEAFQLYKLEYYAGCLTLLYGQLEGILTDYLIQRNLLIKNGNFYNYSGDGFDHTYKNGNKKTINSSSKITGIDSKVIIAANFNKYFEKLDAYKIDSEYKINNDRNDILHGNILDRFTKERCFILVVWLTSIFNFLLAEQKIQESLSTK